MENKTPTALTVTVRKRETILFTGEVTSITSINEKGRFDVLPEHENFITVISSFLILKTPEGKEKQFDITSGVMKVYENTITVYLDITT